MKTFLGATLLAALFATTIQLEQNVTNEETSYECECGLQNKVKRVVGGNETEVNEYPWVVAIIMAEKAANGVTYYAQVCGGSLISSNWVLSATHCFHNTGVIASNTMISLGDHDLGTKSEAKSVHRNVSEIITHPDYDDKTHDNDIALLKMATPVEFASNIQPICLPPKMLWHYGKTGIVAGWGKTSEAGPSSLKLRKVSLPVLKKSECTAAYGSSITSRMFCAGYLQGQKDACQGDSGGPFFYMCPATSRYMQLGIVSFGEGCARPKFPGVYTKVNRFLDFVFENTKGDNLCGPACKT